MWCFLFFPKVTNRIPSVSVSVIIKIKISMEETLKESDFFKSSDLSLISTLQLYGYSIEAMDRSNLEKIVFVIKRDKELDNLIQSFWSRNLKVEPLAYFESLKNIKSRIYQ